MRIYENHSLLTHNTFGIDVQCQQFIEITSATSLQRFIQQKNENKDKKPLLVIGKGSNILFTQNFNGTILHSSIRGRETNLIGDYVMLRCGSGETWDEIVQLAIDNGWHGIENLSLIPSEVGAAAVQNIGAYGIEIKDFIAHVEAIDLHTGDNIRIPANECGYDYRYSKFKDEWKNRYFITHVTLRLSTIFKPDMSYKAIADVMAQQNIVKPTPQQLRDIICDIRQHKLPDTKMVGNAGSFFKNPIIERQNCDSLLKKHPNMPVHVLDEEHCKISAAWLIEQCGWKGINMGDAGVWQQQPLVLVNLGTTEAHDILQLAKAITDDVNKQFNIQLQPEVLII